MPKDATQAVKEETALSPVLYNPQISQTIPFELSKTIIRNGKRVLQKARLTHTLGPLSDIRYFEYEAETEAFETKFRRTQKATSSIFEPKIKLWNELAEAGTGYGEKFDWKESVHQSDKIRAIDALLQIEILDPDLIEYDVETEIVESDVEFRSEDNMAIPFRTMFSGALLLNMAHAFRQETKAELDEFFAIEGNDPMPNALASSQKITKAEKLCKLGNRLLRETEGYAASVDIPAWHLAGTTRSFFLRQLGRMGKF